jgi:hypothetical protein
LIKEPVTMASSVLEVTRDLVLAYIQKFPVSQSAYSANAEAAARRLREEILSFTREVYGELSRLESGAELPPLPPRMPEVSG